MTNTPLNWKVVDDAAIALGAPEFGRLKWRQPNRGVPLKWRVRIAEHLAKRGVPVSLADFDALPELPGRIAA